MQSKRNARRALAALVLAMAMGGAATAEQARQDPAACRGQAEIRPLQPLTIITSEGPRRFAVEVAANDRQREIGMMCRRAMGPDRGMLFDFKRPQPVAFWMRNTLISLDMIFIRADGVVLSVARNARPLDESPVPAGGAVLAVLEIRGGRAAELGILPGDRVVHAIFKPR